MLQSMVDPNHIKKAIREFVVGKFPLARVQLQGSCLLILHYNLSELAGVTGCIISRQFLIAKPRLDKNGIAAVTAMDGKNPETP